MTAIQLGLYEVTTVHRNVPGIGRVIDSPGGNWRARWTGRQWGWVFYRSTGTEWETWEPDLPHGQAYVHNHAEAEAIVEALVTEHGDRPLTLHILERTVRWPTSPKAPDRPCGGASRGSPRS